MTLFPKTLRVQHEIKRRLLTVVRVEQIAQQMVRIVFQGDNLKDFISPGFDDHVKLFFPATAPAVTEDVARRDYTPRYFNTETAELWIEFFLHDAGPATTWAAQAKVGDTLEIAGPRGSFVLDPDGIDTHIFIGDETAFPAISRRLEELPASSHAIVVFEKEAGTVWPALDSSATLNTIFVERTKQKTAAETLIEHLDKLTFPAGKNFIWVALESQAARLVRRYLREQRGIEKEWLKVAAYWKQGEPGASEKLNEDT